MAENEPQVPENKISNRKLPDAARPFMFQPGVSGNPGGRPKKKLLTEVTEELLAEKLSDPVAREEYKEELWKKLLSQRVVGSMTLEKVWDRTEGKVAQQLDVNFSDVGVVLEEVRKRKAAEDVTVVTNSDEDGQQK